MSMSKIVSFGVLFLSVMLGGYAAVTAGDSPLPGFTASKTVGMVAEEPVYKDGDYWVYKLTVDRSGQSRVYEDQYKDQLFRIEFKGGAFTADNELNFLRTRPLVYNTDSRWYRFPLKVGDTWSGQYRSKGKKPQWVNHEVKVTQEGELETKAGKFRVLESRWTGDDIVVYAYSPDVKAAVAIYGEKMNKRGEKTSTYRFELIEYGLK